MTKKRFVLATSLAAATIALAGACGDAASDSASSAGDDGGPSTDRDGPATNADGSVHDDASSSDGALARDGADASTGCPAGSVLQRALTSCPGAPLSPPASLVTALAAGAAGDVVALGGLDEETAPCLPALVCIPSDAPSLLFSDSPESPASDGVLYADVAPAGHHRFYVYHANGGTAARKFTIVALNAGAADASITITRRGLAAPSTAYVSVGKTVLLDWLTDRAPTVVTVPAGQRVLLDPALDALHAAKNELVHAIYDVVTDAPLKISFVSVLAVADAEATTAGLSLLPRDVDHQRGTFPSADVLLVAAPGAQKKGVQRLRLGSGDVDLTMHGIDAPTGDPQTLLGNYGLHYRIALGLGAVANAAIAPRGGEWGGGVRVGSAAAVALPSASASLGTQTDAILFGAVGLGAPEARLLTAGGSNLAVDLFVVTP